MGTGESGANGAHVQKHANKENNHEHVTVIHQLHNMLEKSVQANDMKFVYAMTMFHVQVNCSFI